MFINFVIKASQQAAHLKNDDAISSEFISFLKR